MRAAGDRTEVDRLLRLKTDDLALLRKITQHWFRHKLASDFGQGRDGLEVAKNQGGWQDTRSVLGYLIYDTKHQRQMVEERGSPQPLLAPKEDIKPGDRRAGLAQNPHSDPPDES